MIIQRRRHVGLAVLWLLSLIAHRVLVVWLAEHDWIGAAISGRVALAGAILVFAEMLRVALWVVAPVWLAYAIASKVARP